MEVVYYAKCEIDTVYQGKVYNSIEEVPKRKIGLVLGCSKYLSNGLKNLYFQQRIDAARDLYFSDEVKFLLVSGDNPTKYYDEPTTMKKDLIALGVPWKRIYSDYAGLSKLDSVVRTKEEFKENQLIVISQVFHVRRAIYLGLAHDIDLIGYAPQGVSGLGSLKTELKESLARGKALLDVKFLNRQPKLLGDPVIIK